MATEAGIPAPTCETRTEESAKMEEQEATIFPPNKLPREEKTQLDQLHELPEESFEADQVLRTASITKISSEANHVSSCELAENPAQPLTNITETLFLRINQIDDQPLVNTATSTKDTSSEILSHDENKSAKSILDVTCTGNELQGAESSFLQENDTLLQKDATGLAIPEDSEKMLENTVNDSPVEVQGQSKTLEEVAETHTEKTGANLPIQVEDSQLKDDKCSDKENNNTSQAEVTTVPDKIIFEEEVILLTEQTQKPEELLHATVEDIKPSGLDQDAETKKALKDEGFSAEPHQNLGERTEETVNEVVQTEERPVVQNVPTTVSDEELEENLMIKVEGPGKNNEECLEKESKESFTYKTLMKGEIDEEASTHEPKVEKEDQLKSGFSEYHNDTLLEVVPQIEKPVESLQDGSEEIRAAFSSQNMTETISLQENLASYPREIPDQTEEETHEVQKISNTGKNSGIQVGSEMEVEEHFKEGENPSISETRNNNAIVNEGQIKSELLEKEEHKESILMMGEAQKELAVESLHVGCEDVNTSTLSQNNGTKSSVDVLAQENHVKGILENVEAANSVTITAELSEENTCLENIEATEISENAKEETISFLKSEPLDAMNSHEAAADEVNPEASKPNDDITEHNIVNEEVSHSKSPVAHGTYESETEVANLLSIPLIDISTKEISLKEVRLDDNTNYDEDLDIPTEKLSPKESAETLTGATSDKDELEDLMENTPIERQEELRSQSKTLEENSESHSNPTATDKSGENSPIQVEGWLGMENDKPAVTEATRDYTKGEPSTVTESDKFEEEVALQREEMVKREELLHATFNDNKGEDTEVNCSTKEGSDTLTGAMSDKDELVDLMENTPIERQEELRSQSKTLEENSESHSNPTATDKSGENSPIQVEEWLGMENDKPAVTEATRDYTKGEPSTVTESDKFEEEVALQREEMVKPEELLHATFNDNKGEDTEVNCSTKEGSDTLTGAMSDKDELVDLMENTPIERQEELRSQSKTLEENSESHSNPTATDKSGENSPIQVEEWLGMENDKPAVTEATRDYTKGEPSTVTESDKFEEEVALQREEMVKPKELLHATFNDNKGEDTEVNCSTKEGSDTVVMEDRAADVVASKEETFENISIAVSKEETGENSKTEVDYSLVKDEECFEKESTGSSTSKAPVKDDSIDENEEIIMLKVEAQREKHAEILKDASKDIETVVSSKEMEKTIYLEQNTRADPQENLDDQIENQTVDFEKGETLENIAKTEENAVIQVNAAEMELEEHLADTEKSSLMEKCSKDAILFEDEINHDSTILTGEVKEKTPVESLHVTHEEIKAVPLNPYTDDKAAESLQSQSAATIVPSEDDAEENSPIQHLEQGTEKTSLENADLLETMHEAETGDRNLQKEGLLCAEKNEESTSLKMELPTEHLQQPTESIEQSNLDQDTDTTCSLVEENDHANQQKLLDERTDERTADTVAMKEENVEDTETPVSSEQTGGSLLVTDTESIVSNEPKIEECLEKENNNLSSNEATRDYINDVTSAVTDDVKSVRELALLKKDIVKSDESPHADIDGNKPSALSEDTETKYILRYESASEEPLEKLSYEIGERAANVVAKEKISEVQNIIKPVSDKETANISKTEAEDSQVTHEECFEKESTESYTSKAIVKDDYEELKVENEENSFLSIEAQSEKNVESIQDAFEDIDTAVSSQNIVQKLRADPQGNLDDLKENQTVDVEKCETLEQNITKSEENSVTRLNGSAMELEEQFYNTKTTFTETSEKDTIDDEGLSRSTLLQNEEYKESTSLTGEAQEEKPVESLQVAHEDIKAFASSPCIVDKEVESLGSQSAATFGLDESTDETSSMQDLTKDSEKSSLANADLPEHILEAEIKGGDLQKEELFCSAKNVESTLLKKEMHIEEPIEHLQHAQAAVEPSNSNQDTDTASYIADESLNADRQEVLGKRTEKRTNDVIDKEEETVEDVPKATSSEQTGGNTLSGDTQSIVFHETKVEEVPTATQSKQTERNSLICDVESIVSNEPNVESKSDMCGNTLIDVLDVKAETEKPVQTTNKNIALEDPKTPVSSQNTDGTHLVDEQPLIANPNKTLDHKIEATAMDTPENLAAFISNDDIREDVLIQFDGSQHIQEEKNKEESEQSSTETFTRDTDDDDDKPIIANKLKDDDEDLSNAELFQCQGNRDFTLLGKEAREEKLVESLHTSPEYYNLVVKEAQDEKSTECVNVAPKDDQSQETEIEKEIADEVEPVDSLHVLDDEKTLGQDIEVAKENNDLLLTEDREVKKVEVEKPMESLHALDDDKSLSRTIEVAKEDAFHGDDNALLQNIEVAREEIKEADRHVQALHVALEDKALSQDNEAVKEEVTDDAIIQESMHVPHVEDKASRQVLDVENEDAEELKPLESLQVAYENDNSTGQDTKSSKEKENCVMSLPVAREEENSLSQESEIAKAEAGDMIVMSLDVTSEDDKSSSHKTEVTEKENLVETLSVTPEDEKRSQDNLVVKDEEIEEKPTTVAPEHDILLCHGMEVVKEEMEVEKPLESLHTAPEDDEALCQDKEVTNQKTEEDYLECVNIAHRDDKPLSHDTEAATKEVDEQNHADSFYVSLEKDNESNKDNKPANEEDDVEQLIESSQITSKNDSDYAPAKEDEDNIVTSHQAPEHQSKEMKEDVNDVVLQPKVQDEPETAKKDSGTDMPVIDNQYNDTPHSTDTKATTHKSVDPVQKTTEMEGKNTSDNIGTVHDGQKNTDSYEKEIIYHQSEEHDFTSTQITQDGCEEVTNSAENSPTEVKEMMPCDDEKKIIELDKVETGKYTSNPEAEGTDTTKEVVISISEDSDCNEKELSSTELSEEAKISHEKFLDVTSLVSEASVEEKSDHKNVAETGCNEGTEVNKLEEREEESTTISTKENVELRGASMEVSEITQDKPKLEVCQAAVNEITLGTKEIPPKEIETSFLPRETALVEDQSTTERELDTGKMESLQNEEAETGKEDEEEVSERKKLLECSSGAPIMVDKETKDLLEPSEEKNYFRDIYNSEVVKDEEGLSYDAIKATASDISEEICLPARLEEVDDPVSQAHNCNVISEAEKAKLTEKKFEATPTEIKSDVVSEKTPKAVIYEATETVADMSREKIHKEDQDTENDHIGSCEEETIRESCQQSEANQGEDEFEFIINRYEDKEVKNSNIEFLEDRDNKATVDSIDSLVVNAAGQELKEKPNEDAVHDVKLSEMTQKNINVCDISGEYTNTTMMIQQDEDEIKHEIPEGLLGKESEKWNKYDENCTSYKVDLNDENTVMLEAEKGEEEKTDTLVSLTANDSEGTCIEATNSETPENKQVEPELKYAENLTPDSSICDKNILESESNDSKESSSLAETETLKPSKQESSKCGNEEHISNDTAEEIEKSEPANLLAPSLSDVLHTVPAKESSTYGEKVKPEKMHEAEHGKSKTDEEKDDEEECGEHHKSDSSSEAPVMVEAGDADVKVAHKKSHNLLSGVGSKVKHSIAKVKKAITGKSSHPKPTSPK